MPRILLVSGFQPETRARDLAYEFERFGSLVRFDVPAPRNPHATSNPYAFVEFRSQRDAEDAYYDMHGRYFEESRLSIQWAKNSPFSVWRFERRDAPNTRSGRGDHDCDRDRDGERDRSRSPRRNIDKDRDMDRDRRRRSRTPERKRSLTYDRREDRGRSDRTGTPPADDSKKMDAIAPAGLAMWSVRREPRAKSYSFPRIRGVLGHYYVDKTELIEKIISMREGNVDLVLRPRRSGKNTMLGMLRSFFYINEPNQKSIFEGLYIASKRDICKIHMGKYAFIHLDLKNISGSTWDIMQDCFGEAISDLYQSWEPYLRDILFPEEKAAYEDLLFNRAGTAKRQAALASLSSLLARKSGRGVVVLIDEYEAPINRAFQNGYYEEAKQYFGHGVFSPFLKGNPHVSFAILAGVSPTAKTGWVSGLNTIQMHPLHAENSIYSGRVMFTQREVERLMQLSKTKLDLPDLKAHYNSYLAGGTIDVYNPVSIISALRTNVIDNYWVATGRYPLLEKSIGSLEDNALEYFEKLLARKEINVQFKEDVHFNIPDLDSDGIITLLYYGGYLTMTSSRGLKIPNLEVLADWSVWITGSGRAVDDIVTLCAEGPVSVFSKNWPTFMQATLHRTLVAKERGAETRKTPERLYQVHLLGLLYRFQRLGWKVVVEEPFGTGYIDIHLFSPTKRAGVLIELKSSRTSQEIGQDADKALQRIIDKQYRSRFAFDGAQYIREYGIACYHLESIVKSRYMIRSGDDWLARPDPATVEGQN